MCKHRSLETISLLSCAKLVNIPITNKKDTEQLKQNTKIKPLL